MKELATNTRVIMLAIIAVSGVAIFFNFDELIASDSNTSTTATGQLLVGNVEVVKRDGAGNIVAYRQGSNHIVLTGMEIIARQVFGCGPACGGAGGNNTNDTGLGFGGGLVRYMEIGNGSAGVDCDTEGQGPYLGFDNATLECPLSVSQDCLRVEAAIDRRNATDTNPTTGAAQLNMTAVATFSGASNCDALNIGEAGIWQNSTADTVGGGPSLATGPEASNLMFARNTFGTVTLSTSDSLELNHRQSRDRCRLCYYHLHPHN